jgi:hypothetical protein
MILHLEALTALVTTAAAILGYKIATVAGEIVAQADVVMPVWLTWLLGPAGTLVALAFALKWMGKRLEKAEEKSDAREATILKMSAEQTKVVSKVANALDALVDELENCPCGSRIKRRQIQDTEESS